MLGNGIEMSLIFGQTLGPLVLGWAPNHFVLGAQLAPGKKRLPQHFCLIRTYDILFLKLMMKMMMT